MQILLSTRKRCDFPLQVQQDPMDTPLSVVNDVLDLAAETKGYGVSLVGNEPVLHPYFVKILSQFQKKGVPCILETSGLMPTDAKEAILEYKPMLIYKIYRPVFYSETDLQEAKANLQQFVQGNVFIQFLLHVDDLEEADYSFIKEWASLVPVLKIFYKLDCGVPVPQRSPALEKLSSLILQLFEESHVGAQINCHTQPCCFSDETFGKLAKINVGRELCSPHLLVRSDGTLAHCLPMRILPGPKVTAFKSVKAILDFYYDIYREMQCDNQENTPCVHCSSRVARLCTGPSMFIKATELLRLKEELKPQVENPDAPDTEEQNELLWSMAHVCIKLAIYNDAIQCLEELRRRHPERPEIHYWLAKSYGGAGRIEEAADEFRKTSRIGVDPIHPLLELHSLYNQNGNFIKARMLQEEIKQLIKEKH